MGASTLNTKITALVLTPGSGEFVYDTQVITGLDGKILNSNISKGQSDASVTLESLLSNFPDLTKVAVMVGWFADTTNAGKLTISPRVEYNSIFKGDPWSAGGYTRAYTTKTFQWGGTPSDSSVIHLVTMLKKYGLDVTLYPVLYVDDKQKSWRGDITASSSDDLDIFFKYYSNFITSCANMQSGGTYVKDLISGIVVGSELEALLRYDDGSYTFPAVQRMQDVAANVKKIVGPNVSTIYAANWTEYGRDPASGYYYLDPLFDSIDKIGISAFFRLTHNLTQDNITRDDIINAWNSGIDYDFWVDGAGNTGPITDPSYALKNIYWWYTNQHINPDGNATTWAPSKKEVIATEIGFASVDCTSNQPSAFYNPDSVNSAFPPLSSGTADVNAQMLAIDATQEFWSELHANDTNGDYTNLFTDLYWYEYDMRGDYSISPKAFADAEYYQYSHCLKPADMAEYIVS